MKKTTRSVMLLVPTLLFLPALSHAEASDSRWIFQERMEIGRALVEVQATNWPSVLPYYTEEIEYHDPIVDIYGIDAMAEFLGRLFGNSSDLVTTIEDESLFGSVYTATWTMAGQFAGVPYSAKGISILKFRRGTAQVYYQRDYYSENDIMINIPGLDEAVIGFRTFYRCAVDPTFDCPLTDAPESVEFTSEPMSPSSRPDAGDGPNRSFLWLRRPQLEVGRALVEIDASNWTSLLQYYTDDIQYRDPIVAIDGIETMTEFLGRLFVNSPDLITTVEDETLVNGVYTATWTMTGLFNGVPIDAKGMSIVKFRGSSTQVYYSRDYYTEGDIMASIPGLDQVVTAFRTFYRCAVDPTFECPPGGRTMVSDPDDALQSRSEMPPVADRFARRRSAPGPFDPVTGTRPEGPDTGAKGALTERTPL